jgi:hypothetical protein
MSGRCSVYVNTAFAGFLTVTGFRVARSRVWSDLFIGDYSMLDRRQNAREKVIYGGVAEVGERGATKDCVVRNISEKGARIEFNNVVKLPKEQISLTIARKGRSFLAKIIWWRDNFVGVAFSSEQPYELPVSDLEERLRKSEQKKRQLQRRIKQLLEG